MENSINIKLEMKPIFKTDLQGNSTLKNLPKKRIHADDNLAI